jgi:hypothetical protein
LAHCFGCDCVVGRQRSGYEQACRPGRGNHITGSDEVCSNASPKKKISADANSGKNIPHFPDIPRTPAPTTSDPGECGECWESLAANGESRRDFQPHPDTGAEQAASGMSGLTGMFSLPLSQAGDYIDENYTASLAT